MNPRLEKTVDLWQQLAAKAKETDYISYFELLEAFKEAHNALCSFSSEERVPRGVFLIIMLMDEFTYYAAMTDENYLGDICPGLYFLNYALKDEFFKGEYRSEFFMGNMPTGIREYISDIEELSLDDFILFLKTVNNNIGGYDYEHKNRNMEGSLLS